MKINDKVVFDEGLSYLVIRDDFKMDLPKKLRVTGVVKEVFSITDNLGNPYGERVRVAYSFNGKTLEATFGVGCMRSVP